MSRCPLVTGSKEPGKKGGARHAGGLTRRIRNRKGAPAFTGHRLPRKSGLRGGTSLAMSEHECVRSTNWHGYGTTRGCACRGRGYGCVVMAAGRCGRRDGRAAAGTGSSQVATQSSALASRAGRSSARHLSGTDLAVPERRVWANATRPPTGAARQSQVRVLQLRTGDGEGGDRRDRMDAKGHQHSARRRQQASRPKQTTHEPGPVPHGDRPVRPQGPGSSAATGLRGPLRERLPRLRLRPAMKPLTPANLGSHFVNLSSGWHDQ